MESFLVVVLLILYFPGVELANVCGHICVCKQTMHVFVVNCSHSKNMSRIPNLRNLGQDHLPMHLSLKGMGLTRVERSDFESHMNIVTLDLSENRGIVVKDDALLNVKHSLEQLFLASCQLDFRSGFSFLRNLHKLNKLVLAGNVITAAGISNQVLKTGAFSSLPSLREIDLDGCTLSGIENEVFPSEKLTHLSLSDNHLSAIPANLTFLSHLDVTKNRFQNIPRGSFHGYERLTHLWLGYNSDIRLDADSFDGLESTLKTLDLRHCGFTEPPVSIFSLLPSLNKVILRGNKIRTLTSGAFSGLSVRRFDLSSNPLYQIDRDAFENTQDVLRVDLSETRIRYLDFLLNYASGKFDAIFLKTTKINCSCTIFLVLVRVGEGVIHGHCISNWSLHSLMDSHTVQILRDIYNCTRPCDIICKHGKPKSDCSGCVCAGNWTGKHCETCGVICKHGKPKSDCSGCGCAGNWTGEQCETCDVICIVGKPNSDCSGCVCAGKWTGKQCERCGVICKNGKQKSDCSGCVCGENWTGKHCDKCNYFCDHNGTVNDQCDGCHCIGGWTGKHCSNCSIECRNKGVRSINCTACRCPRYWTGQHCDDCNLVCKNRGVPKATCDACSCVAGTGGKRCEHCYLTCINQGYPDDDCLSCKCKYPFTGRLCDEWDKSAQKSVPVDWEIIGIFVFYSILVVIFGYIWVKVKRKRKQNEVHNPNVVSHILKRVHGVSNPPESQVRDVIAREKLVTSDKAPSSQTNVRYHITENADVFSLVTMPLSRLTGAKLTDSIRQTRQTQNRTSNCSRDKSSLIYSGSPEVPHVHENEEVTTL